MKFTPVQIVGSLVVLAVLAWVGKSAVHKFYTVPVATLDDEITRLQSTSDRITKELDNWIPAKIELRSFGATLLSREFDQTEHRLRTALQDIGKQVGLGNVRVSSSSPKPVRTPLAESRLRGRMLRSLADARDFAVVRGSFTGVGTLEQVATSLAFLQSQPWLHRIERVSIEPRGRERQAFEIDVGFAVAFAPDLCPKDAPDPTIVTPEEGVLEIARAFAARNVFVPPPPPPTPPPDVDPTPDTTPPPPPLPAQPPYDRWKVTGLIERRIAGETTSVEAWVLNLDSGERRELVPGDEVLGVTLVWVVGECGVFEFEGNRVVIHQGQTLADRVPADSVDCPGVEGVPSATGARTGEGE